MNLSFENKYKDRTPEETIKIIEKFFTDKGYLLYKYPTDSDIGTFSYFVFIEYKNQVVLTANGKGATDLYALASGLAELYERFCIYGYNLYNNVFMDKIIQHNFNKNNYYFDKDEKVYTDLTPIYNEPLFMDYFEKLANGLEVDNFISLFTDFVCDNKIIGIPFKNILNQKVKYLDPRILIRTVGSTGMAGGNSYKEAFVQGFSEVLERYIVKKFLTNEFNNYVFLDLNQFPKFKKYLDIIHKQNKEFFVIDASYEYKIPVVIGIMVDKNSHWTRLNFASFPQIEIAIERLFTEMYQNVQTLHNQYDYIQIPYLSTNPNKMLYKNIGTLARMSYFPEVILNSNFNYKKPSEYWLRGQIGDNEIFYAYYENLIKEKELNVYIYDHSKMKDMYSIQIFVDNLEYHFHHEWEQIFDSNKYNFQKIKIEIQAFKVIKSLNKNLLNINLSEYFFHMNNLFQNWDDSSKLVSAWGGRDWSNPLGKVGFLTNDLSFLYDIKNCSQDELNQFSQTIFYEPLQRFIVLARYCNENYSENDLITILNFLGIYYTKEDVNNINNFDYLLMKIFIEPFIDFVYSDDYDYIISTFIN